MSCEGCKDQLRTEEEIIIFGERLGKVLGAKLSQGSTVVSTDQLSRAFNIVLNSMDVPFREERMESTLHYSLDYCPLCESGSKTGMGRELEVARLGFAAFSDSLVRALSPDWKVLTPTVLERLDSLLEIRLSHQNN